MDAESNRIAIQCHVKVIANGWNFRSSICFSLAMKFAIQVEMKQLTQRETIPRTTKTATTTMTMTEKLKGIVDLIAVGWKLMREKTMCYSCICVHFPVAVNNNYVFYRRWRAICVYCVHSWLGRSSYNKCIDCCLALVVVVTATNSHDARDKFDNVVVVWKIYIFCFRRRCRCRFPLTAFIFIMFTMYVYVYDSIHAYSLQHGVHKIYE